MRPRRIPRPNRAAVWLIVLTAWPIVAAAQTPAASAQGTASARAHYSRGTALEAQHDLAGAEAAYRAALETDPAMADAHDRLGFVLGKLGRTADAIAEFERAVALQPDLADAQYHLGATLWWTKQIDAARKPLERAVALRPTHAESRYYLGLVKRQQGDIAGAIDDLRIAVKSDPSLAAAHLQLGVALQARGDLDGAVTALRTRRLARSLARRRRQQPRARADAEGGRRARGADAEQAVERHPDFASARLNLGTALMQTGDLGGAVDVYRELTDREPANAEAFYDLGLALKQQRRLRRGGRGTAYGAAPRCRAARGTVHPRRRAVADRTAEDAASMFREALSRRPSTPTHTTCSAPSSSSAARPTRRCANSAKRSASIRPSPRPTPRSASCSRPQRDPEGAAAAFAEAQRLNRMKADSQAAVFAVNAGLERLQKGDLRGGDRALPRGGPARPRQRAGALSARAGAAAHRRPGGSAAEFDAARRLAPYLRW